jgi:hypothetical protein
MPRVHIYINDEQDKFLKDHAISPTKFFQNKLAEEMKREKIEVGVEYQDG